MRQLRRRTKFALGLGTALGIWLPPGAALADPAESDIARGAAPVHAPRTDCGPGQGAGPAARGDAPFRVTVDGVPLEEDGLRTETDRRRCVDVGLERADVQIRYDPLNAAPALNAWATKSGVLRGKPFELHAWSNYRRWISKAEIRVFAQGEDRLATPLAVLPIVPGAALAWRAPDAAPDALVYILRAYDPQGRFDETGAKPLALLAREAGLPDPDAGTRERLAGYGENSRSLANIPVRGGTVTVSGRNVKPGESVAVMGAPVPVDANGAFADRQIMPAGPHSIEVSFSDANGRGTTFRRNLSIADKDWFYVALADLTIGRNSTTGPAQLVTGDTRHYDNSTYVDGRGAFYLKGLVTGEYLLTASADTREQPFRDLFSNFSSKDPRYLLRRIDPDRYYPVYGDDSTTVDDAPTQGKFYVRLAKGESHAMWGNFQTAWTGTELTQFSRGLYGANLLWRPDGSTSHGERRTSVNAFAAEPGTIASREEFRGTGGSLYYLRHLDITQGSERLWIEVRDKDSGFVLKRTALRPAEDYEINYLQGRVLLRAPLASTAADAGLVQSAALSGHPVHLVVTYEYAPGVTALDALAYGLRAHHWVNDHLALGVSGYRQGSEGADQRLRGADLTLRYKPGTWLKAEAAHSEGAGNGMLSSIDGGFGFNQSTGSGQRASAQRIEGALDLADFSAGKGKLGLYWQDRQAGYSAPGQIAPNGEATRQSGASASVALDENSTLSLKADDRHSTSQDLRVVEGALRRQVTPEWGLGAGLRHDNRATRIANASPTLSQNGERTDVVARIDYRPLAAPADGVQPEAGAKPRFEPWSVHGFVQGTAARSGDRASNDRVGAGATWQATDRLKLSGELSGGDGGPGGRLGGDWQIDDRSNAYLTWALENERPDAAFRGRHSTLVSGSRYRWSDQVATFGESRWSSGAGPESLTHAFGLDYAPADRWTTGVKFETGTLSDPLAGDLKRNAIGLSAAYREERTRASSALEYRQEDGNLAGSRRTWLMRNTFGHQATRDWRALGKFNFSSSKASAGRFFDGDFVEIVTGAAWRPVDNSRWNSLLKYTYFYTVPSPGQVSPANVVLDFAQKSHVFNFDVIHELRPWVSLGFKYGLRIGELKSNKVSGDWFASRAHLVIGRLDFHWVKEWDAIIELRRLAAREAGDARTGVLLGVYRRVADNVKVGVGYNFTDFSDNLTELSYRSKGWFVNVLSAF